MKKGLFRLWTIYSLIVIHSCTMDSNPNLQNNEGSSKNVISDSAIQNDESYKSMDTQVIDEFNQRIINEGLVQLEEILNAYAPKSPEAEGNYQYNYTINDLDEQTKEITLIETGLMDDSMEGRKVFMQLIMGENNWKVVSIKETYKCWPGRGHETWSAEPCL